MEDSLLSLLMSHCNYLDAITAMTDRIAAAAKRGDMDYVSSEASNKDRAINSMADVQSRIEALINSAPRPMAEGTIDVLRTWADEFTALTVSWGQKDSATTEAIDAAKEDTTKELAAVFRSREQFRGYNLGNVKK